MHLLVIISYNINNFHFFQIFFFQMDSNVGILHSISDKLQNASRTVLLEKKREREEVEQRLQAIQSNLHNKKKFEGEAISRAKHAVQNLSYLYSQTLKGFNIKGKKEEELARCLKEQIETQIQFQQREHENRIQSIAEKQTELLTNSIDLLSKKLKGKKQKNEKLITEMRRNVTTLQKQFKDEVDARTNNCRRIKDDIEQQINKFTLLIERQQQKRAESQKKICKMMEEINEKLVSEIDEETAKRKKNNDSLLQLIELACQKLEQRIES